MDLTTVAAALPPAIAVLLGLSGAAAVLPAGETGRRTAYGLASAASLVMALLAALVLAGAAPVAFSAGIVLGMPLVSVRLD